MDVRPRLLGLSQVMARLNKITRATQDFTPAWRDATRTLTRYVQLTFDTQGARSGRRWRRLRRRTTRARKQGWGYYRRGGGGAGRFANVFTGTVLRDFVGHGPRHIERVTRTQFEWGADYPVGRGSGRNWYRRVPFRRGRGGQRVKWLIMAPMLGHLRRALTR